MRSPGRSHPCIKGAIHFQTTYRVSTMGQYWELANLDAEEKYDHTFKGSKNPLCRGEELAVLLAEPLAPTDTTLEASAKGGEMYLRFVVVRNESVPSLTLLQLLDKSVMLSCPTGRWQGY